MEMILESVFLYLETFKLEQDLKCLGLSQICGEANSPPPLCTSYLFRSYYDMGKPLLHLQNTFCSSASLHTASVTHHQGLAVGPLITQQISILMDPFKVAPPVWTPIPLPPHRSSAFPQSTRLLSQSGCHVHKGQCCLEQSQG